MLARKILLQKDSLANAIYEEQRHIGWPRLAKEATEICKQIGVADVNEENATKDEIEDGIFYSNYMEMKEEMKKYETFLGEEIEIT